MTLLCLADGSSRLDVGATAKRSVQFSVTGSYLTLSSRSIFQASAAFKNFGKLESQ